MTRSNSDGNEGKSPPTEVKPRATRRRFTANYKNGILEEADACTQAGELGALLRREGLYSSHLSTWRAQRERGKLEGLTPRKRGPKSREKNPLDKEVRELKRENTRLRKRVTRAEALIEVQKKVSELWGVTLQKPGDEEDDS
jgi:transposase-like protein